MRKTTAALTSALVLSAFSTVALAQDEDGVGLSCADIEFSSAVTSRASDIDRACRDVVELNGRMFAKTRIELTNVRGNRATWHFVMPDGRSGTRHTIEVPSDWRATIDGREYRMRELSRGQELNVYLPPDRWEAHFNAPTSTFTAYEPAPIVAADDDDMGSSTSSSMPSTAMLPATAGPLPLFGLFGGIALLGAGLVRVFRRR